MEAKTSQCELILKWLHDYGKITTFEAFVDLGITRLASRICDLNKQGYEFKKEFKTAKNRYGKLVSFLEYSLAE